MEGYLWLAVLVALMAWALAIHVWSGLPERLAAAWVSRARRQGRWAGPLALLGSSALVGLVGLALLAGPLVVDVLVAMVYVPFASFSAPSTTSGNYSGWRSVLADAGADPQLQRRIAWWGGPPSLAGLALALLHVMLGVMPG